MKRVLYFDAAAGVSGDMFVGALIDAGADFAVIREHLGLLRLDGFTVRTRQVEKQGITGTKFDVLSIPTLLVFKNGEVVKKLVGAMPKKRLADELAAWL